MKLGRAEFPRRITMVAACPFPNVQGSQVLIQELITGLAARGHKIDLVTYPFGTESQWRLPKECRLHRVPLRIRYLARHPGFHPWKPVLDAALARLLEKVVRREGSDLIHAHSHEGLMAALWVRRRTKAPVLYHSHTLLGEELPTYYRPVWIKIMAQWAGFAADRCLPPFADHCIALSQRAAQTFLKMGLPCGKVSCFPPFVFSTRGQKPPGFTDSRHSPYILYAGNLHPYQDVELLLRSFQMVSAQNPAAHLVILTHNDPAEWKKRTTEFGLADRVRFETDLTFEEELDRMSDASVLVLPRLRCSGYPMKLLNYLAAGRPIVASEDSARGLTHGRSAYVVTGPEPRAFAQGVLAILGSRPLAIQLAQGAARTFAEDLDPRGILERIETIYGQMAPPAKLWVTRIAAATA